MRAGTLRHHVRIERPVEGFTEDGEVSRTWQLFAECWASVEPLSGREYYEARQTEAAVTHHVRMRYRSSVLPSMRIVHGARILQIGSVIDVGERHMELDLVCTEVPE